MIMIQCGRCEKGYHFGGLFYFWKQCIINEKRLFSVKTFIFLTELWKMVIWIKNHKNDCHGQEYKVIMDTFVEIYSGCTLWMY
jgi:hypothetical protein